MEHILSNIDLKPSDYIVCQTCNKLNWYENTECSNCGDKTFGYFYCNLILFQNGDKKTLKSFKNEVVNWIKKEYNFWKNENYSKKEINSILIKI